MPVNVLSTVPHEHQSSGSTPCWSIPPERCRAVRRKAGPNAWQMGLRRVRLPPAPDAGRSAWLVKAWYGILCDKASWITPLEPEVVERVVAPTLTQG
jgi:hypothetical protein